MIPQPPSTATHSRRTSRLDRRTIFVPVETLAGFQAGSRRLEAARPATSETQRPHHTKSPYVAETTSYFPKIQESAIARDKREKQLALTKQIRQGWKSNPSTRIGSRFSCSQQVETTSQLPAKALSTLDQDGMAVMRLAFERRGRLGEKEFIAEMLHALNSQDLQWEQQVSLTHELGSLYKQADLHAAGFLTWEDFSATMFKSADEIFPEENADSQRVRSSAMLNYQTDALNTPAELHGMHYFDDVDRVFLHDARRKGFRLLDPSTNVIVGEFTSPSRGCSIVDAVYSPVGRYVITASTSPVIALYDIDKLRIRQQIPTEAGQTALEISMDLATPRLYSSCTNGQVHVWNMDTLSCSKSFFSKGHEVITDIAAIHSTTHVAASSLDGKIYVLDLHLERIGKALNGHEKGVTMLKYCANKGYLVSGGLDHCLSLWNPHVEQKIGSLKGHKHQLVGLEVVPGTPQVISSDESGLVKIWDLRMFAPLRSFKREVYVKDHTLPRTLTRPMRTMCYMASRKRIAIAHSSIFFVDLQDDELTTSGNHDRSATGFDVEERSKPLAVVFHRPSSSIVLITPREFQSWSTHSRTLIHREKMLMKVDATCVSMVEDHYSCIMGTEDGTIARAMLPRGSVILSKRLHSAEIAAVRWVNGSRQIVSSSFDGTVLISLSANLEVLHSLNHWQGIRSVSNNYASLYEQGPKGNDLKSRETQSTVENFIRLFNSVDYAQTGKITAQKAKELLDGAFMVHQHKQSSGTKKKAFSGREAITLTAFLKKAQTRLRDMQHASLSSNGSRGPDAVSIDVHSKLQHLVTVSPFDGTFCVWKLKGGSLVATGAIKKPQLETEDVVSRQPETRRLKTSLVGQVVYLDPLPYFVLVEEGHPSQLSIWSSTAIPSVFPYGHQRILCLQYGAESNAQCNETRASSRKYLQKPCEIAIICAALWMAQDTNCSSSLLCIGDDHGYVAIYEFDALIQEIEYLRELESSRETSRSERRNVSKVLPNSLVKLRCQWLSRKGDPVRVLSPIHQVGSSESLVAITHDSGATSFYTTEGVCVGDLFDRSIPWQLQIDQSDSNESNQIAAVKMLQDLKTHRRVSQTLQQRQSQVKQDRIRNAAIPTNRKNSEEYAKQRPGLSRFLAVANQL